MDPIHQDEIELRICLTRIGFNNDRLRNAIIAEGFASISDMADITMKDVQAMCKKISGLPNARGGVLIGYNLQRRLKGFVFWVKDHHRRGQEADVDDFDLDICKEALERMDIEEKRDLEDAKIDAPGKLKSAEWLQWELKLVNFLQSIPGASGVPLNYVIRKDVPDEYDFVNEQEELINMCPLVGAIYNEDNRKVFGIIKQSVAETPNWDWIKTLNRAQDGRAAMEMLRNHFDGPGEIEKRIAEANQAIDDLHYVNETKFPFSLYVTALNAGYKTLEEANEPLTERNKVSTMLKGIRTSNPYLTAAIQSIRTKPETKNDFTMASNELSEQIAIIYPSESRRNQMRGGRRMSSMSGRGNRGGRGRGRGPYQGRGRGEGRNNGRGYRGGYRGGRGRNNNRGGGGRRENYNMVCNGVDISDATRTFSNDEWYALPIDARNRIHDERERKRQRTDNGPNNNEQRDIAAMENAEHEETNPANPNESNANGRAPGFGRGAYRGRGRDGRGRG